MEFDAAYANAGLTDCNQVSEGVEQAKGRSVRHLAQGLTGTTLEIY